jgi:hypothetical protein
MEPRFEELLRRMEQLSAQVHELREGIRQSVTIAEQDPEMSLTRARKVLEYVVRDVYERRVGEPPGTRPLENLLQRLVRDAHLPKRLAAYANAIRELGNVGSHGFGEGVTRDDVYHALTQLVPIIEWYFQNEAPAARARAAPPRAPGAAAARWASPPEHEHRHDERDDDEQQARESYPELRPRRGARQVGEDVAQVPPDEPGHAERSGECQRRTRQEDHLGSHRTCPPRPNGATHSCGPARGSRPRMPGQGKSRRANVQTHNRSPQRNGAGMPRARAISARTKATSVSARPRRSSRPPPIRSWSRLAMCETANASGTPTTTGSTSDAPTAPKARLMFASKRSSSPRCGGTSRRTAPGSSHGRASPTGSGPASITLLREFPG